MNPVARKVRRSCTPAALAFLAGAAALLLTLAAAGDADAAVSFCQPQGSGAGECSNPQGVATDFETERVYLADRNNHRVSVFEADGSFVMAFGWDVNPAGGTGLETCTTITTCKAGVEGSGAGQLSFPTNIAVDNTGGAEQGKVYVTDFSNSPNFRVQRFNPDGSFELAFGTGGAGECEFSNGGDPIAIGPGGNVFVADTSGTAPVFTARVEKFSTAGACLGETVLLEEENAVIPALAVDSAEDLYVAGNRGVFIGLRKYEWETAAELCGPPGIDPGVETNAIGFDDEDHLFASQREPDGASFGIWQVITEYEPDCDIASRFGYGLSSQNQVGLAALHTVEGDVFAAEETQFAGQHIVRYLAKSPPGPIVVDPSLEADPIRSVSAEIKAEVNPEGKETEVTIEYEKASGGTPIVSDPQILPPIDAKKAFRVRRVEIDAGCIPFSQEDFEDGKCLELETQYRYRVIATNADGSDEAEGTFTTKSAPELRDVFATEVGIDTAKVNAEVNPQGLPALGHFEYVDQATFEASEFDEAIRVPPGVAQINFGAGEAPVIKSALLDPLEPGTTYRFHLIATNAFLGEPEVSEVGTFTTFKAPDPPPNCPANEAFRTGASEDLPDCRAYELVSPLDKAGGDISSSIVDSKAAAAGDRMTYSSFRAFGDAPSAPYSAKYLAKRYPLGHDEEGWQSHAIMPPKGQAILGGVQPFSEYVHFSADLCQAWLVPLAEPILAPGAIPGYYNLYRRTNLCAEPWQPTGAYEAISTAKPKGFPPFPDSEPELYNLELQGSSADGSVAVFAAEDNLEGTGEPGTGGKQKKLYAKGPGGPPRFACVKPGGAKHTGICTAGTDQNGDLTGFARGGRRATLRNALSEDGSRLFWTEGDGEGRVYLRTNPTSTSGECSGPTPPCTTHVSKAGEEASGTTQSRFWAAAPDGSMALYVTGGDLYRFTVAGAVTEPIAGEVLGLVGASADTSRVYFASEEVLTGAEENENGEAAVEEEPNLYLHEAGEGERFVGVLAEEDANELFLPGTTAATRSFPDEHNGRVSADGLHAAFMSQAPLTGYDNTDAVSGEPDNEVFLYDASANGGEGKLICASCNPTGARPAGVNANAGTGNTFWIAGRLPALPTALYSGRILAEDGSRLFFEAQDSLVPRDTNGRLDVYQWEEAGTGGCDTEDATYSQATGGCVDLISSGQGLVDSSLLDASADGNDVFFTTTEGLVAGDFGLTDVYDARAAGGFPPPPPEDPECEGETCPSPPAAPPAPTPASGNVGPGNVREGSPRPRCRKGKVRRRGKCVRKRSAKRRAKSRTQRQRRAGR